MSTSDWNDESITEQVVVSEGVREYQVTVGLPVIIKFDAHGLLEVSVDVSDLPSELDGAVAEGSASVLALDSHPRSMWRAADEHETVWVAEYLRAWLTAPYIELDDAPGWEQHPTLDGEDD